MFVQMSGALLPSFSLFCPAIAQPLAEMLMQLVPMDVISQGDRRPLLHHCPGIAIRLTPSKPRKRSPGGDDCSRDRPVRSSEVATTSRMKRTSATFDERSWAPSAAPMSMGPKADSADLQPVASAKSPIRPDHSHWLPGAYSQKLGGKFAQRFCDATLKGLRRHLRLIRGGRCSPVDKRLPGLIEKLLPFYVTQTDLLSITCRLARRLSRTHPDTDG